MSFNMSLDFLLLKSVFIEVTDPSKYIIPRVEESCPESKCKWQWETQQITCDFISHTPLVQPTGSCSMALDVCLLLILL